MCSGQRGVELKVAMSSKFSKIFIIIKSSSL
jgi:hypothetical protein